MIRLIGVAVCAAVLSGCSSGGGTNPIVSALWQKVKPGQRAAAAAAAAEAENQPVIALTFEQIRDSGAAIIRARVGEDTAGVFLYARAVNAEYVTYTSQLQQTFTLRGSLITASRAIGHDLLSVRSDQNDPVAVNTQPQDWPSTIRRDYRFPADGPGGKVVSVTCRYIKGPAFELQLLDANLDTTIMQESCSGSGESFNNVHLVDGNGQIWRSAQWLGPDQGMIEFDILEPYSTD